MNEILNAIGQGISGLGYALDTPGALLRGLLMGRPGERASGKELLGTDSDLLGFGAELAIDPLALLGPILGGAKAAKMAGRGLGMVDDASDITRIASGPPPNVLKMSDETIDFVPSGFEANQSAILRELGLKQKALEGLPADASQRMVDAAAIGGPLRGTVPDVMMSGDTVMGGGRQTMQSLGLRQPQTMLDLQPVMHDPWPARALENKAKRLAGSMYEDVNATLGMEDVFPFKHDYLPDTPIPGGSTAVTPGLGGLGYSRGPSRLPPPEPRSVNPWLNDLNTNQAGMTYRPEVLAQYPDPLDVPIMQSRIGPGTTRMPGLNPDLTKTYNRVDPEASHLLQQIQAGFPSQGGGLDVIQTLRRDPKAYKFAPGPAAEVRGNKLFASDQAPFVRPYDTEMNWLQRTEGPYAAGLPGPAASQTMNVDDLLAAVMQDEGQEISPLLLAMLGGGAGGLAGGAAFAAGGY